MRTALMAVPLLLLLSLLGPPDPAVALPEDDGRVGAVLDLQGTALVRPVGRQRWTPLAPRSLLMPGDQVKTFARGAHAVEIRLAAGGTIALGPNALVEMTSKTGVRLLRGDLEAKGAAVTGPGGFKASAVDRVVYRAKRKKTSKLEKDPRWLTGYRSSTTDEWMGSLVANVDGRNTPLTIGYHKVDVVIRDQIAVTTIEESFVNHTSSRLEGIFTFPLPADASISGFGMWIGDELVMADIVEKQRAREIYEDILRRRKDPGLLEWSGGNLFKARVFPIFAGSRSATSTPSAANCSRRTRFAISGSRSRSTPTCRSRRPRPSPTNAGSARRRTTRSSSTTRRRPLPSATSSFASTSPRSRRSRRSRIVAARTVTSCCSSHRPIRPPRAGSGN
jgi:hypothetical protein